MKTSIIGFPRIGANRELKFASEKFFAGGAGAEALEATARAIRLYGWDEQKKAGIDFIPSGDFSFYDNLLDTAVLLGALPERYRALGLDPLAEYFAAARGYQGPKGDVKALPLKKWFNTNYHYIVPELADSTEISSNPAKFVAEYREAKAAGFETVPTLAGPYTFLVLARCTGAKKAEDFAVAAADAFADAVRALAAEGARRIAFAEPALVYDTPAERLALFKSIYSRILPAAKEAGVKTVLQTYFGDLRDSWETVAAAGFDAIGIDFVEGRESLALLKKHGLPASVELVAGVVNGKNIWRTDLAKASALVAEIAAVVPEERLTLGTSCSLLHVPYTVAAEKTLPAETLSHFAFAVEKLGELASLGRKGAVVAAPSERVASDAAVRSRLAALTDADFTRLPAQAEREAIQKKRFALPKFPTTTIGSFPQTAEVRAKRAAFRKGTLSAAGYAEFVRGKIAECVRRQEELGLDVLVHGEFERNDMVEYFGNNLAGFVFTSNAWVQSYGTRCVKPPVVWGDVSRKAPITVEWSKYAQSLTEKPMKGMLTGPVTILNWSFPREDLPLRDQAWQIALAIRDEVLDLEAAGIGIIQIDEAALREKLPLRRADWERDYLDWAIPAFRLVHSGVKPETQIHTHMCYSEFNDIIRSIDAMDADVITFEASRADLKILDALKEADFTTEVGPGVYDIHSPRVPSADEIVAVLEKILTKVDAEKLWVNPDCGLKTRGEPETYASLANLVEAAKRLRARA